MGKFGHAVGQCGQRLGPLVRLGGEVAGARTAQHSPFRQSRQVAADEGRMAQGGGVVDEGLLSFGGLEQEQHQGLCSAVVAADVVALEVAPVSAQALG